MVRFAENYQDVFDNAVKIHNFGSGNTDQRKFHKIRTGNALHHVVLSIAEKRIFAPVKWCGVKENEINNYHANKYPITYHFRRVLFRIGFKQISPGHAEHKFFYEEFVKYCDTYGFKHSKPDINKRHFYSFRINVGIVYPDDLDEGEEITEGSQKSVVVNRFERDPKARAKCIKYHGKRCSVCDIDFSEVYGDIGEGFIHVHHIKPLSELKRKYIVDPINDLIPVCPNCHAMLHKFKPVGTVRELKKLMRKN